MKSRTKNKESKFNKYPWRGTITTVANEMGTSRQNVLQRYYRLEPVVTELVTAEIKRRENIMQLEPNHAPTSNYI